MAVTYLQSGAPATAACMNALYAEFDTKLRRAFGGKSFLLVPRDALSGNVAAAELYVEAGSPFVSGIWSDPQCFGKPFYFVQNPTSPYLLGLPGYSGASYNHTPFTALAEGASAVAWDDARRIVSVELAFGALDDSLEAHWRLKPDDDSGRHYFLMPVVGTQPEDAIEGPYAFPEKQYRLAVAELVCDGLTELSFPAHYDKYNCFRIHNLDAARTLEVSFEQGVNALQPYVVSVPPLGCKTVRRTQAKAGNYRSEFTYFWDFRPGDGRWFNCQPNAGNYNSMAANNVANPAMVLHWLQYFRARCEFDWSQPEPTPDEASYFGNADASATLLGDLLHHRGRLVVARRAGEGDWHFQDVEFTGHATLAEKLRAVGLTVTQSGAEVWIQETRANVTTDILSFGTNLFTLGGTARVAFNVNTPVALQANIWLFPVVAFSDLSPGDIGCPKDFVQGGYITRPCQLWNGTEYEYPLVEGYWLATLNRNLGDAYPPGTRYVTETVARMRLTESGASPNTAYGRFSNIKVGLTPFGFGLRFDELVTPVGALDSALTSGLRFDVAAQQLKARRFVLADFTQYGYTGLPWLSCRAERAYAVAGSASPAGIVNARLNTDGRDYDLVAVTGERRAITVQQELSGAVRSGCAMGFTDTGLAWVYYAPDFLHAFEATHAWYAVNREALLNNTGPGERPQLLPLLDATQYNGWAWAVNCWTGFDPLQFTEIYFPFVFAGEHWIGRLAESGPFSGAPDVMPRGCRAAWKHDPTDRAAYRWEAGCAYFGIPVLTEAHLPNSYSAAKAAGVTRWSYSLTLEGLLIRDDEYFTVNYTGHHVDIADNGDNGVLADYGEDYRWVRHTAMAQQAAVRRLPFLHAQLVYPYDLQPCLGSDNSQPLPRNDMLLAEWSSTVSAPGRENPFTPGHSEQALSFSMGFAVATIMTPARDGNYEWVKLAESATPLAYDLSDGDPARYVFLGTLCYKPDWSAAEARATRVALYNPDESWNTKQLVALESSSSYATSGVRVENRVLLSPQNFWGATEDYLVDHDPGPDVPENWDGGVAGVYDLSVYRPAQFGDLTSQPGAVVYNFNAQPTGNDWWDHSQLIPMPTLEGAVGRCYHVYRQTCVRLDWGL